MPLCTRALLPIAVIDLAEERQCLSVLKALVATTELVAFEERLVSAVLRHFSGTFIKAIYLHGIVNQNRDHQSSTDSRECIEGVVSLTCLCWLALARSQPFA